MRRLYLIILMSILLTNAVAQIVTMTLDECMVYAVENSTRVKKQDYTNDNYRQDRNEALASLFPSISGDVSATNNHGRSIDPQTNSYTNNNNFSNSYSLSTQMPLFAGLSRINTYRATRVGVVMGREEIKRVKDEVALEVMQAYFDVVYYSKAAEFAAAQLAASTENHRKGSKQEELGIISAAEMLQLEAQMAADDYTLTQQENQRDQAMIVLKERMNYPVTDELTIDTEVRIFPGGTETPVGEVISQAMEINPRLKSAQLNLRYRELNFSATKGTLWPSIYIGGGYSTSFYYDRVTPNLPSFASQLANRRGYYFGATLSVPIFGGLSRRTAVNRSRNSMNIAAQNVVEAERSLQSEIEQNYRQMQGYGKEFIQASKTVEAAELAHKAITQKFEQGVVSALDLQTSANRLLEAQSRRLNAHLQYIIKCRIVEYYGGESLIRL